jgi:hypothetical protein
VLSTIALTIAACSGGEGDVTANTAAPADAGDVSDGADVSSANASSAIEPAAEDAPTFITPSPVARDEPKLLVRPANSQQKPDPHESIRRLYGSLLADVVTPDGLVRYDLLGTPRRRSSLDAVVDSMANAMLPAARDEKLAFLCNAYNANALKKALQASEVASFRSVEREAGFFDKDRITVGGESMTLNELENELIRPMKDARIHAALVCAAMSCPPLRAEPYRAADLDAQFDEQCRKWVNDSTKHRVTSTGIEVSSIFTWYAADFPDLRGFLTTYAAAGSDLAKALDRSPEVPIAYATYDWTLNRAPVQSEPQK